MLREMFAMIPFCINQQENSRKLYSLAGLAEDYAFSPLNRGLTHSAYSGPNFRMIRA